MWRTIMCCSGILVFLALVIGFMAFVFVCYQLYSFVRCGCGKYGPFVSSYGKIKDDILDEARAILKKSKKKMRVTDLGCGSGVLLLPLAKEFPQHEFVGLEWDVVPLTMGKIKARGLKNISFVKGDYMKTNHSDMDLIMCYVLKTTGVPLGKKLAKEIKETAVVISEMFPLSALEEVKQIESSIYGVKEKIFVYKKPAQKAKENKKVEAKKVIKKVATKLAEAKKVELKKVEAKKVAEPKKVETKKVEAKKVVAPKKAEAKKVVTPKKAEAPKKVGAKKVVAPKKAEPKKVASPKPKAKK
ncbi:MAG: methyltransferase domain-containing protein [Alphaproteobacteria bacterium]|nr:methyltransferase domain-containing protein [Alphaproteobacteria bacterium]